MDLLAIAFEPINQFVTVNIHKPIAHEIYVMVIETMTAFQNRIHTYSKKIDAFYEGYINWFGVTINTLQDEVVWKQTVQASIDRVFESNKSKNRTYNDRLVKCIYETSSINQRSFIVDALVQHMCKEGIKRADFDIDFVLFLKEMALDENVFEQVQPFFKVERYNW